MNVRQQILNFLRAPKQFSEGAQDPQIWRQGLTAFAQQSIKAKGDYELRQAQVDAWNGLATVRAGLILGPPGTGKTHLLAWLILGYIKARHDAGLGCRVFVSAFTRNAIVNLLEAVAKKADTHWANAVQVLFLGSAPESGLPAGIAQCERLDNANADVAITALQADWIVAGGSIWSLYKLLQRGGTPNADGLTAEIFDLICIDEASQMVLGHGLLALGGLKPGGRVVVAGDDQQLPPIRASREVTIDNRQLGGSLYGFLKSAQVPEFPLIETFRLNEPLAAFPARKFYDGKYTSADKTKKLTLRENWADGLPKWLKFALDPRWPICVLLHDGPSASTSNPFEADLSGQIVKALAERLPGAYLDGAEVAPDFWTERLAVVSPHKAQNALIRQTLSPDLRANAFVETVDRIQGKERDTVVLSYCVSDAEFALAEGEFIFAIERLNVAVTRARTKLIVIISRKLLDAVPSDQDVMDKAEVLREYVFDCQEAHNFCTRDKDGRNVGVQIRVQGFADDVIPDSPTVEDIAPEVPPLILTPALENLRRAILQIAMANNGKASLSKLKNALADPPRLFENLVQLHGLGYISLANRTGQYGPYWEVKPLEPPRHVFPATEAGARMHLEEAISQTRKGRFAPFYDNVRDRFAWMDDQGRDLLRECVETLKNEGLVIIGLVKDSLTLEWVGQASSQDAIGDPSGSENSTDDDFLVLNALEDMEASRINIGVFESWVPLAELAKSVGKSWTKTTESLGRLAADGWIMFGGEGRFRSRMAELAREVRYVKQRFAREDADRRPYLVRSLKVELRDRAKPQRVTNLGDTFVALASELSNHHHMVSALGALSNTLQRLWGENAAIAGFQARSLRHITSAWCGVGGVTYVIAADTGSGKTEAACLPLIAGALADRLAGLRGTKAILAYPRVRLASNQAQRLVGYLSALEAEPGLPVVTLGLQLGAVPADFANLYPTDLAAGWSSLGNDEFAFPFFACPASTCGSDLILKHRQGTSGADQLCCTSCNWRYNGWIGSKQGLRANPPDIFLPTTDSLHQWMHNPKYGALFGDTPDFEAPRAVLADEIHLYSHVHGAQVAYAFQRLIGRLELNSKGKREALAIGMSATLGQPALAWTALSGRSDVQLIEPTPAEKEPSVRGREYFYFVQPEVESRGHDIAGASTTIQTLMCLAHGIRRRTGKQGGFRSLVFLDSIDKVRRLHSDYTDAEEHKGLSKYRTQAFFDAATARPRDGCCGEPAGCDTFLNGECWWFGANDTAQIGPGGPVRPGQALTIASQPITAAATGKVEGLIKGSDIIFATSTLEVGYDDPDITLVYQHYAPQNLASFVQRKGRGGRGSDDRPTTGVTLSIYKSRDSWWFRRPSTMIEPAHFNAPLNPDNMFVRRGQILAAIFDGLARYQARSGERVNVRRPSANALRAAGDLVDKIFGAEASSRYLGIKSITEFWQQALGRSSSDQETLPDLRKAIDWLPDLLFETINLPKLSITFPGKYPEATSEDISLALATIAPGNATRRFDQRQVFWRPPVEGKGPWFVSDDYAKGDDFTPFATTERLLHALPLEARDLLAGVSESIFRPTEVQLDLTGVIDVSSWHSEWMVTDGASFACQRLPTSFQLPRAVKHDSKSQLRGSAIVVSEQAHARPLQLTGFEKWFHKLDAFVGGQTGLGKTGLEMARVFWGADADLKLIGSNEEGVAFSQVFTLPETTQPKLHGYSVQTEGVQFHFNSSHLDKVVAKVLQELNNDPARKRWHAGQMLRHVVETRSRSAGVNAYDAQRGAELLVSAASDPNLRPRLNRLTALWSDSSLKALFQETRRTRLSQHPLLSESRVDRTADALSSQKFREVFGESLVAVSNADNFATYIKSVIINSVAARLRDSFIQAGSGDERKVVCHVDLPLQFGPQATGVITLCEAGSHGDGTTRAFIQRLSTAAQHWQNGFISQCPNALEDEAMRAFFESETKHAAWRTLDPTKLENLSRIASELGLTGSLPASVIKILWAVETVGFDQYAVYDLALSLQKTNKALVQTLQREPSPWEFTSMAVTQAENEPSSVLGRLLTSYASLQDARLDDSLSPQARLADQVFRLHGRLCEDGCQACVHQDSELMTQSQVESSTSRRLLCEFVES